MAVEELQRQLQLKLDQLVEEKYSGEDEKFIKKKGLAKARGSEIVKVKGFGKIVSDNGRELSYKLHMKYLYNQAGFLYLEEEMENRVAVIDNEKIISDEEVSWPAGLQEVPEITEITEGLWNDDARERVPFHYNRLQAVQYAERWWNENNPAFKSFPVDCTNFVSQCLYAGDAPMRGYPNKGKGWWMRNNNWSYSWTVAHSMRWYLQTSKTGLRATEVLRPDQLELGDVICYDFEGDGRFNHTTIVTALDQNGMPLVNAHTVNSRMRYWSYEDSTAYTDNIKYKFFHIKDDLS